MIKVSKYERSELERVGLLKHRKVGYNAHDANFTVVNREHLGRSKKTYVTEEPEIMLFLGRYWGMNLQRVNHKQFKQLINNKLVARDKIQKWGTYVPGAIAFEDSFGNWRVKKIPKIMFELGIWSENKSRTYNKPENNSSAEEIFMSAENGSEIAFEGVNLHEE